MRKLIIWGIITFVLLGNVFAKDDLCPNRDEKGQPDCGISKERCMTTKEQYNFIIEKIEAGKFKYGVFDNYMNSHKNELEETIVFIDRCTENSKKTENLTKEKQREIWNMCRFINGCGSWEKEVDFIECMDLADTRTRQLDEKYKKEISPYDYEDICRSCIREKEDGDTLRSCELAEFKKLEDEIILDIDSEDEEENDNEEECQNEEENDNEEECQNKEGNPDGTEENVEEQQDEGEDEALEENGDMDGIIAGKEESTTAEQKQQNPETVKAKSNLGIKMNSDCLVHGGCSLDVYKTLGMRADSGNEDRTSVLSFFQDIIGAATFFIGTIVTIAFVWSGFQCVVAGRNGDSSGRSKAVKGMLYSIIGLIIVMSSYAIIRLVQYLAATGG